MSIKIKPLEEKFKNADTETKNQLWRLAIEESFKQAISEDDFKKELKLHISILSELEERIKSLEKKIKILIR